MANLNLIANSEFQANIALSAAASPISSSNANVQATPGNSNGGKGQGLNAIWTPASNITAVYGHQTAYETLDKYGTVINQGASTTYATQVASAAAGYLPLMNSLASYGNNTGSPAQWTTDVLGGSYTTGQWTFRGSLTGIHNDAITPEKLKTTGLGAKYVMGTWEFNASRTNTTQNSATAAIDGTKATATILWAQYNISKTTFAYVGYDKTTWDATFTGSATAPAAIAFLPTAYKDSTGSTATSSTALWAGINKTF